MSNPGDEPPAADRPGVTVALAKSAKHRRRKRRGRRTRWPSVAAAGPKTHPEAYPTRPVPGESTANATISEDIAESTTVRGRRPHGADGGSGEDGRSDGERPAQPVDRHAASGPRDQHRRGTPANRFDTPVGAPRPGGHRPADGGGSAGAQDHHRTGRDAPHRGDVAGPTTDGGLDPADRPEAAGEGRSSRHRATGPLYAALDLGTNNCRLLVAEPWHHGFRVVDAFSRIVRLGEGLSKSGRLSEAAQDRAIEALQVCRTKLDGRGIVRSRLVATEACRAAENGEHFLDRVEAETGLKLEILTRETEARLAVAGCANLIDWSADGALLFDIGGGSSELVWLEFGSGRRHGGDPTRHIRAWTSLPVGVVTLSERHGGVSVGATVFEAMVADVDAMLAELDDWRDLAARLGPGRYHMVGTSGTVTTLAGVHLGLKRYDRRRVDGTWLSDDEVGEMIGRLLRMDFDDRVANPCIGIDRADLVLAGCAILEAIRRRWRCGRLRVADRGLREGMLTELMIDDGLWYRSGRGRRPGRGGERSGR